MLTIKTTFILLLISGFITLSGCGPTYSFLYSRGSTQINSQWKTNKFKTIIKVYQPGDHKATYRHYCVVKKKVLGGLFYRTIHKKEIDFPPSRRILKFAFQSDTVVVNFSKDSTYLIKRTK